VFAATVWYPVWLVTKSSRYFSQNANIFRAFFPIVIFGTTDVEIKIFDLYARYEVKKGFELYDILV
jgi:hypothetical protein